MLSSLAMVQHVMEKDQIWSSGPIINSSLWQAEENWVRPRIISRLQAFLDTSSTDVRYSNLRGMAKKVLKQLKIKWGDPKPMDLFPAFMIKKTF